MGEVVELDEDAEGVSPVYEPPQEAPAEGDEHPCDHLPHDRDADREPGLAVVGFPVGADVLFYLTYARVLGQGGCGAFGFDHFVKLLGFNSGIRVYGVCGVRKRKDMDRVAHGMTQGVV